MLVKNDKITVSNCQYQHRGHTSLAQQKIINTTAPPLFYMSKVLQP